MAVILSVGIQFAIYKIVDYRLELPQAIFSIPLILIGIFLLSIKRGEWSIAWHGGFYDKTLDKKRESLRRTVEWDRIRQSLDENLLLN